MNRIYHEIVQKYLIGKRFAIPVQELFTGTLVKQCYRFLPVFTGTNCPPYQKVSKSGKKSGLDSPCDSGDQVKERDMDRGGRGIGGIGGGVEAVNSSHGKHRNQLSLAPLSICLLAILRWTTTSGPDYFLRKIY